MDEKTMEKLAESLTWKGTEILPYLPYLLQDLWELGSSPTIMVAMLREHAGMTDRTRVLDLACGKGAVAVRIAKEFGCPVLGVDIMPEFIEYARAKAEEHGVTDLCSFEEGDAGEAVRRLKDYDVVIWGAVGDILGNYDETIAALKEVVKPNGFILLDDAYLEDPDAKQKFEHAYPTLQQWRELFAANGLTPLAQSVEEDDPDNDNDENNRNIQKRAEELKALYPDQADLFDGYVQSQLDECDDLEGPAVGVTWLLRKG